MLNLRYHLVSIIAIFLALGLGVVVGATVVDRGTVAFLQDRLDEVEEDVARTEEINAELRRALDQAEAREAALAEEASGRLVGGLLQGVPVILVRLPGVETAADDTLRTTLAASGASVDPVVTLTNDLRLGDVEKRRRFVETLELREGLIERPEELAEVAARRLAAALWAPAYPPVDLPPEQVPRAAAGDLDALTAAGFVTLDYGPDAAPPDELPPLPSGPAVGMVLLLTDPLGAPDEDAAFVVDLLWSLARSSRPPNIVVATTGDGTQPPMAQLRRDEPVIPDVATVDDALSFAGRLALVLALRDGPEAGVAGHFGSGPGADRLIPPPPP